MDIYCYWIKYKPQLSQIDFKGFWDQKMKMVIYGIRSIESYESPRLKLTLAKISRYFYQKENLINKYDSNYN